MVWLNHSVGSGMIKLRVFHQWDKTAAVEKVKDPDFPHLLRECDMIVFCSMGKENAVFYD